MTVSTVDQWDLTETWPGKAKIIVELQSTSSAIFKAAAAERRSGFVNVTVKKTNLLALLYITFDGELGTGKQQ